MSDEKPKAVKRAREDHSPTNCDPKKSKVMVKALQLVDINDDCLQKIFEFLDLEDLVNVAEADEQFISAATSEFSRRNRAKQKVDLGYVGIVQRECCESENNNMDIAAFFRHFGCIVSSLSIDFLDSGDVDIENLLQNHCTDSLVNLDLTYIDQSHFNTIDKTFPHLETLVITVSTVSQKLSQFETWCPNLISLELNDVKLSHPESFVATLPQLKHLTIFNYEKNVPKSTMCEMLMLNPQLESLTLYCDYDISFFRLLSENTRHLNKLEIWTPDNRFLNFGDEKICFENVKTFRLNSSQNRGDFVVNMPFLFTNLQKLTLDGFNEFSGPLLNFIKECKNLKTLNLVTSIEDWDDLTFEDLEMIVDSLPKLVNLKFCADAITMGELIQFLSKSKNLQKVNLLFIEWPGCPHVCAIESEWSVDMKDVMGNENADDHVCFSLKRKK